MGAALDSVPGIDNRLKAIEAAAPQIVQGLQDLGNAARALKTGLEQAGDGLKQLKAGLEQAGAGLKKLGDAYGAVEYGVVRLYNGSTAVDGATLVSPDIPDDGNTATAAGQLPFISAAGGEQLSLRGAIRSAEDDGGATGDPAGQAGGILYAVCASPPGAPFNGACGAVQAGQIGCQTGPPPVANGNCTLPQPGVWNIFVTSQFVDLPTSATPGPKD